MHPDRLCQGVEVARGLGPRRRPLRPGGACASWPSAVPTLDAGMVVLTGGTTAPIDLERGLEIELSAPQLGSFSPLCT